MAKFDLLTTLSLNAAGFTSGIDRAKTSTQGFQNTIKSIGSFLTPILSVTAALGFASKVISSTSGTADKFEEVISAAKLSTDKFFGSLAGDGGLKNLTKNLETAALAGKNYAAALDLIEERSLGAKLNVSQSAQGQKAREEIFRDKSGKYSGAERQTALTAYKEQAVADAQIALELAEAQVIAENDKLKGLGIEANKIKELYSLYNSQLGTITKVSDKLKEIEDLNSKINIATAAATQAGASFSSIENLTSLNIKLAEVKSSMSAEELAYAELLKTNDKTKQENIDKYINSLINVNNAKATITAVDVENLKIQTNITNEIKDQNIAIQEQLAIKKMSADKTYQTAGEDSITTIKSPKLGSFFDGTKIKLGKANSNVAKDNTDRIATLKAIEEQTAALENQQNVYSSIQGAIEGIGGAFSDMLDGGKGAMKGMVTSVLEGLASIAQAYLAVSIAALIASESRKGLVGLVTASLGIGLLMALWKSKVPAFAAGGISQGGLSLVGERGAELVDLPAGARVFSNSQSRNLLKTGGELTTRVSGSDLIFVLNNSNRKLNSYR